MQVEFFNGIKQISPISKGARCALTGIRSGVIDSIQTISTLALGRPEYYPENQRKGSMFFYETENDPKIEESIKTGLRGQKIDMSLFLTDLPSPPSTQKIAAKYFIVLPHENISKEISLPSAHYGNEISIITTYDLGRDYYHEEKREDVFNRGYVMGAHMAGHLFIKSWSDGHCDDVGCCMHPHLNGIKDVDEIIRTRREENRKKLFCKDTLNDFKIGLNREHIEF